MRNPFYNSESLVLPLHYSPECLLSRLTHLPEDLLPRRAQRMDPVPTDRPTSGGETVTVTSVLLPKEDNHTLHKIT
jgi:hypothetical protein